MREVAAACGLQLTLFGHAILALFGLGLGIPQFPTGTAAVA